MLKLQGVADSQGARNNMAIGAMAGSVVTNVLGGVLGSGSGTDSSSSSQGYAPSGGLKMMGATGDPAGFIFNQIRFKKNEKYQKSQDKITNALVQAQTEQLKLQNRAFKDNEKRQKNIRNIMMGYK